MEVASISPDFSVAISLFEFCFFSSFCSVGGFLIISASCAVFCVERPFGTLRLSSPYCLAYVRINIYHSAVGKEFFSKLIPC